MQNSISANRSRLRAAVFWHILMLVTPIIAQAQQKDKLSKYLTNLPSNLELEENKPQKYLVTADYFNGDIFGNFANKTRVAGEYTRGFEDGSVKWNNVTIANGNTREGSFENAVKQEYMENFTYVPSAKMIEASSFTTFPPNSFQGKNLVWDVLAIEGFAWSYFDSLKLNQPFNATDFNGELQLAGEGTFENRNVQLKWIGISQMNNEVCALIEYRTFDNSLTIDTEQLKIKGRSHYWGTIWVSLDDKQVEHAVMYEDVVMDMKMQGQTNNQLVNTTREIVFEKLN